MSGDIKELRQLDSFICDEINELKDQIKALYAVVDVLGCEIVNPKISTLTEIVNTLNIVKLEINNIRDESMVTE